MIELKISPVEASLLKAAALAKGAPHPPKKPKTATYNLTLEQIEAMKKKAVDDAVAVALPLMLGLPAMVLTDKHGFTPEDIDTFTDGVLDLYDSFHKGYLTLDDIHAALKEECGLEIREKAKRRKFK